MAIKTDRSSLDTTILPSGQQRDYLVLPENERLRGFIRPVRQDYRHVGPTGPTYPIRDLTPEEAERYSIFGYIKYEEYPHASSSLGKYWTAAELERKGCGTVTHMGLALSETYARQPSFYSGTFCSECGKHFPVGPDGEFIWLDGEKVGT